MCEFVLCILKKNYLAVKVGFLWLFGYDPLHHEGGKRDMSTRALFVIGSHICFVLRWFVGKGNGCKLTKDQWK